MGLCGLHHVQLGVSPLEIGDLWQSKTLRVIAGHVFDVGAEVHVFLQNF